jgi:hypothetical protein
VSYGGQYTSAYLGDVLMRQRLRLNLGLRWDRQTAKNCASESPANAAFPSVFRLGARFSF